MMYNLPKFNSEKAAKNPMLSPCVHITCFENVVEAISTGGQTGSHTLFVIMEGVDKPVFQMIWVPVYITTNGVHAACNRGAWHSFYWPIHKLAIVTLRTVGVEPPVYIMTSAYARCIRFLSPLFWQCARRVTALAFVIFIQIFCCLFGVKLW